MIVSSLRLEFWRAMPVGGFEKVDTVDHASFVMVYLPTLPGGTAKFTMPEGRDVFDGFMIGLSHGHTLGRDDHKNEMRKLLGFEASRDVPRIKGPRHASR